MNYTGFVYLWYDRKHKLYCIGSRKGTIDDGYVTSTGHMLKAYKKRPEDFKRRILEYVYGDHNAILEAEQRWLDMIKDDELYFSPKRRYYNRKKNASGIDSKTASELKKKFWDSDKGRERKKILSEQMKGNTLSNGRAPWNKGKECPNLSIAIKEAAVKQPWTDERRKAASARIKKNWENGVYDNRPAPTPEHIEKIRQKTSAGNNQNPRNKRQERPTKENG